MLIFLAEPDQNLRLGLQMLLHQERGMHVIGVAVQAKGLLVQVEASQAEILIVDWHLPGASMPDLIKDIRALEAPPKIIVLSVNPEAAGPAIAAGADAFVRKNTPPDELMGVIRSMKNTGGNI